MANLLHYKDITWLWQNIPMLFQGETLEEVILNLKIFDDLRISQEIFEFNSQWSLVLKEQGVSLNIPIVEIYSLAKQLNILKNCKNFNSLSFGLNNPAQFSSTIFEVKSAYHFFCNNQTVTLEFSPSILVNGKPKNPDFSFLTKKEKIFFVECKSLKSTSRLKNSKINKIFSLLNEKLLSLLKEGLRIEISFKSLPKNWNRNYTEQITAAIKYLIENKIMKPIILKIDHYHETFIKLSSSNEELYFKNCIISANKQPFEKPNLVIGENASLTKDIKNTIKDAITQLPQDHQSLICIETINEKNTSLAVDRFFSYNKRPFLYGIFSYTDKFKLYVNPSNCYKDNIF